MRTGPSSHLSLPCRSPSVSTAGRCASKDHDLGTTRWNLWAGSKSTSSSLVSRTPVQRRHGVAESLSVGMDVDDTLKCINIFNLLAIDSLTRIPVLKRFRMAILSCSDSTLPTNLIIPLKLISFVSVTIGMWRPILYIRLPILPISGSRIWGQTFLHSKTTYHQEVGSTKIQALVLVALLEVGTFLKCVLDGLVS